MLQKQTEASDSSTSNHPILSALNCDTFYLQRRPVVISVFWIFFVPQTSRSFSCLLSSGRRRLWVGVSAAVGWAGKTSSSYLNHGLTATAATTWRRHSTTVWPSKLLLAPSTKNAKWLILPCILETLSEFALKDTWEKMEFFPTIDFCDVVFDAGPSTTWGIDATAQRPKFLEFGKVGGGLAPMRV